VDELAERFPAGVELLADAAADLLAFTAFPKEHRCQGTPEIASSNYLAVLVFLHFIKLAFTIGIESSFQILEIRSQ